MFNDGPLAVIAEDESWHCHTLLETEIEKSEGRTSLGRLYRLWRKACRDGIPTEDRFSPNAVFGNSDREGLLRISTGSPNPMDYTIDTPPAKDTFAGPISIGALDPSIQHRQLTTDLLYCRHLRTPVYQEIQQVFSMAVYSYRRLLLPVEDEAGSVSGIFLCFRMVDCNEDQLQVKRPLSTRETVPLLFNCHQESTEKRDIVSQERRMLQIDKMFDREFHYEAKHETSLVSLYKYWHENRRFGGRLPLAEYFDPSASFTPDKMRWISWVDVAPENPFSFVLHNHPGKLLGNYSGTALRDYPFRSHGIYCAFEYDQCKKTQQPAYHEFSQQIGGYQRQYARVLLPTVDRNGKVTRLYYGTEYLATPLVL